MDYKSNPVANLPSLLSFDPDPHSQPCVRQRPSRPASARSGSRRNSRDWSATMVRMALSVRPAVGDGGRAGPVFACRRSSTRDAGRRQIEILMAPHSYFPREGLQKVSRWYAANPLPDTNGKKFFGRRRAGVRRTSHDLPRPGAAPVARLRPKIPPRIGRELNDEPVRKRSSPRNCSRSSRAFVARRLWGRPWRRPFRPTWSSTTPRWDAVLYHEEAHFTPANCFPPRPARAFERICQVHKARQTCRGAQPGRPVLSAGTIRFPETLLCRSCRF